MLRLFKDWAIYHVVWFRFFVMGREKKGLWKGRHSDIPMYVGWSPQAGIVTGTGRCSQNSLLGMAPLHHCCITAPVPCRRHPILSSACKICHLLLQAMLTGYMKLINHGWSDLFALWVIVCPMRSWHKPAFRQLLPCVVQYLESSFHP